MKRVYTYAEAAQELQVSKSTIRKLVKSGVLWAVPLGERSPRIPASAIRKLLGESPSTADLERLMEGI